MNALTSRRAAARADDTGSLLQRPTEAVPDKTRVASQIVKPRATGTRTPRRLRVAAVSLLACAPCNPFTDDGLIALDPPKTEPTDAFRMKHWIEVEILANGAAPADATFGHSVGVSEYCGQRREATTVGKLTTSWSSNDPIRGQVTSFKSYLGTRVGADVPSTIPLAPCGDLGSNNAIPVNWNTLRVNVHEDGAAVSWFEAASKFPYHYIYEDRQLKTVGGKPYHPIVDYDTWATSTGIPLSLINAGFTALGTACCNKGVLPGCYSLCANGKSYPIADIENMANCIGAAGEAIFDNCRSQETSCGKHGTDCPSSALKKAANP